MAYTYNLLVKKIGIFAISPLPSDCLLEKSVQHYKDIDFHIKYNNKTVGLCEYYNSIINSEKTYDVLIFCHHDVSLDYCNLRLQVEEGLKYFDVIGVAGCREPKIAEKNLWHWMSDKQHQRGFAAHPISLGSKELFVTAFGPTPARVAVLDGVFLALDARKIRGSKARFDEQFLWHHYDIDFSLTCNKNKIKLGVWPVIINHQSPGLLNVNDVEWNRSNKAFIEKWTKQA